LPYPQGERVANVLKRVWPLIEEIVERYLGEVAIVTHGGVILVLISACLNLPLEHRFNFAPLANCGCSTLCYDHKDDTLKVEKFNVISHLDRLKCGNLSFMSNLIHQDVIPVCM
jgi:broad specificity phosphatase PhoE